MSVAMGGIRLKMKEPRKTIFNVGLFDNPLGQS